ncbi:MAG: hydrogenase subunit MbhD domain-containing protein [archaeon]
MLLLSLYYVAVVAMIVMAAIAIHAKDLLYAVIIMGGSLVMLSIVFLMLKAPDVAITQAAVNGALGTALYVFAVLKTRRDE